MKRLIELIQKIYGKSALSKTLGTRTNVITLSDNEAKKFIKEELNIEAASEAAAMNAKKDAEALIAEIPRMNDQEILTFTNNLQRLDNKLNPPSADVIQMGTKQQVSPEGIEQLAAGQSAKRTMDEIVKMNQKEQTRSNQGLIRTAVRFKMMKDLREGKLDVPEDIAKSISQVGSSRNDPIKIFEKYYGPDALETVDQLSPEFRMIERNGGTEMDLVKKIEDTVDARPLTKVEIEETASNTREAGRVMDQVMSGEVKTLTDQQGSGIDGKMRVAYQEELQRRIDEGEREITFEQFLAMMDRNKFNIGGQAIAPPSPSMMVDTTTYNPIPENAANMAAAEIAEMMMGVGSLKREAGDVEDSNVMTTDDFMYNEYLMPKRKELMENYGLTLQEADDMIRDEMSKLRTGKAKGGRIGYAYGSGKKLIQVLEEKGKDMMQELRKAVDNIFPTGDSKYDADVALESMLEELDINVAEIDEKDIIDAYGTAYDMITQQRFKNLKTPTDQMKELGAPKMAERFELKQKYPGIDEELLTKIIEDTDPQRKAEALATIDQAFELMKQGKSPDEVLDIMKQMTDRTKQAEGGLNYLSGF